MKNRSHRYGINRPTRPSHRHKYTTHKMILTWWWWYILISGKLEDSIEEYVFWRPSYRLI